MNVIEQYKQQRLNSIKTTSGDMPARPANPFFGVGPITDMVLDEVDARRQRIKFERWIEENYIKYDDRGNKVGNFTVAELNRSMHRGYPADKVLCDMMDAIHGYFNFPEQNRMAVGLGGGHSGFSVAALHLMSGHASANQKIYVDTPKPESGNSKNGGFFRQSWGAQLLEIQKYAKIGDPNRIHFADIEGGIPSADTLSKLGITLFFGVGHETTGASAYTEEEANHLLEWIALNPTDHHAVIDATSLLGAMAWSEPVVKRILERCNMFLPFQKAVGGVSGYFVLSLTPQAMALINENQKNKCWAIPRQLKITAPTNPAMPITGKYTTDLGPIYDPKTKSMQGGVINTYSILAFAETTFGILQNKHNIGSVDRLNQQSKKNRKTVEACLDKHPLFVHGVPEPDRRGAAVTLLKVNDPEITDDAVRIRIIAKSKQILGYEGMTHPNGDYEPGLDVARYVNAFPGTPGDYRAWVGGIRQTSDILALFDNLSYAYHRAKIVVLEEELEKSGVTFKPTAPVERERTDDPNRPYKVLIADVIGMLPDKEGHPNHKTVQTHIEKKGGVFHVGGIRSDETLTPGVHFFYQPDLSKLDDVLSQTETGQYDAVIAAATHIPPAATFVLGGVRIGAGTGNMQSKSWGGANGVGGSAPLTNTPGFNAVATAQAVMKALLKVRPALRTAEMHARVVEGNFDTGHHLKEYPCVKLEGLKIAIVGYGNIGRETAKLAKAFGLDVFVHAYAKHKEWIESEGFSYADSIVSAATGADILSLHIGLGTHNADTGTFGNAGIIDASVFSVMNPSAVLINYDRGELVNVNDLDHALVSGQIDCAAIDADIFIDDTGALTGPMVPYRDIARKHPKKIELLPHASADTDHTSRVSGAKQAVDQIFGIIRYKTVVNLKGDLPDGYIDGKSKTVCGVGKVSVDTISSLSDDTIRILRDGTENIASFWGAVDSVKDPIIRKRLIDKYAGEIFRLMNSHGSLLNRHGLVGPFSE